MGEVCRADDMVLGQPVALKFLPESLERNEDRLRRFLNEVRVARQISHPSICRVYDIGEAEGHHFISMEFVDGEDLSSLMRRIGRLPEQKALEIARQLCAGLAAAHDKGILHRDLKPANIMIDGRGRARITDFGLAGWAEEIGAGDLHAGTPDYMAPEQLAGREVSVRSDIYALGCVLYELFTGKRPFRSGPRAEISRLRQETTPETPSTVVDGLDPAVERVLMLCLERDPRDRPRSALAVAAALPGGDPLAAALAAGEIPSPEMIAAAGPRGGMTPRAATAWLAIFVLGLILLPLLLPRVSLYGKIPLEKPLAAFTEDARRIVQQLGYETAAEDRASWFEIHRETLQYFAEQDAGPSRWDSLSRPGEIAVKVSYRQAEHALMAREMSGRISFQDPNPRPGDVTLTMGLDGRLLFFKAVPSFMENTGDPAETVDWTVLFEAAGLDRARFEPVAPRAQPQTFGDERAAWEGVLPHRGDLPVRVEAIALRGRPVFFETVTPYDDYWSDEVSASREQPAAMRLFQTGLLLLVVSLAVGAIFMAVRNFRLGRGDRRGALRLAGYVLILRLLLWVVGGHHVPDFGAEFYSLIHAVADGLILAVLCWVLYVALEPYFRRLLPEALVSWTRLLAGRLRDPLVGRDLLIGFALGMGLHLLTVLAFWLPAKIGLPPPIPLPTAIDALAGGRFALAQIFKVLMVSLAVPLLWIVLFLLLRVVLRLRWLAMAAFCLILSLVGTGDFAPIGGEAASPALLALGAVMGFGLGAILLVLILRFGVLSTAACFLMANLVSLYPVTYETSAPYFGISLVALLVAAGLAAYAFSTALAGRPLFQDSLLHRD
jgi:serine/threonine-protein kinase